MLKEWLVGLLRKVPVAPALPELPNRGRFTGVLLQEGVLTDNTFYSQDSCQLSKQVSQKDTNLRPYRSMYHSLHTPCP